MLGVPYVGNTLFYSHLALCGISLYSVLYVLGVLFALMAPLLPHPQKFILDSIWSSLYSAQTDSQFLLHAILWLVLSHYKRIHSRDFKQSFLLSFIPLNLAYFVSSQKNPLQRF